MGQDVLPPAVVSDHLCPTEPWRFRKSRFGIRGAVGMLGCLFIMLGGRFVLSGIIMLLLFSILDAVDGNIARVRAHGARPANFSTARAARLPTLFYTFPSECGLPQRFRSGGQ